MVIYVNITYIIDKYVRVKYIYQLYYGFVPRPQVLPDGEYIVMLTTFTINLVLTANHNPHGTALDLHVSNEIYYNI